MCDRIAIVRKIKIGPSSSCNFFLLAEEQMGKVEKEDGKTDPFQGRKQTWAHSKKVYFISKQQQE